MSTETADLLAAIEVPEPDRSVLTTGDGAPPLGQEGDIPAKAPPSLPAADVPAGHRVPKDQGRISSRQDPPPIGRDREPEDRSVMALEPAFFLGRLDVPDAN